MNYKTVTLEYVPGISSVKYNIYCYADDLLLSSTMVTGLQPLNNKANSVISKIGLKFNPPK